MLEPRDPVEGIRELEGSLAVDLRVALPPNDGPVRPVVGRRIEPEPELFRGVDDSTRERLRGTKIPVGVVRVAPLPGDDVPLLVVDGLADGLRGAEAVGVPIRLDREPPTRGPGLVLVALLPDPLGTVLRDDRLRAPMPPVVLDWPLIVGMAGEVERGAVLGLPRDVFNAPILERVLGANTLGAVPRPEFDGRVAAPVAGTPVRAGRTLSDRARTPGFADIAGTALVPLARWLRIAGGLAGFATALRAPVAADERAAGVAGRVEPPPAADRALVPDLARASGFLYVMRKSVIELRKRSCWDSNDTRAVPSRRANGRFVRNDRKADALAAGAWTNRPWLERAGTTGTGPRIETPVRVFAIRRLLGVCWAPRPKSWASTYETPR